MRMHKGLKTRPQIGLLGDFLEADKCVEGMDFMKDWQTWRTTVKEAISQARKLGLSEDKIHALAVRFASFLADRVCPATPEEELLKEMWNTSSPDERKVLARILFKMMK